MAQSHRLASLATVALVLFLACTVMAAQSAPTANKNTGGPDSTRPAKGWTPARTPWGDPDLQGTFTNKDENGIPLERPKQFEGRNIDDVKRTELPALLEQRHKQAVALAPTLGGAETGAGPIHWFEYYNASNSRPWMIVEPADGKIPPLTPDAQKRRAALIAARHGHGDADSAEERSLYDRCITRGVPGSMMPTIYGNSYQIVQGPGYVAVRYEMIHETRIIPLDGRPHAGQRIGLYMGDARGRWDGNSLVVETTNFNAKNSNDIVGYGSPDQGAGRGLRIVERFTPTSAKTVEWSVTLDDAQTWTRPWTFAMSLTKDENQTVFEYACHEGNYGLHNILSAARADEAKAGR